MPLHNPMVPQFGDASNYLLIGPDGTLRVYGTGTAFDDLLTAQTATRTGVVAPTSGTGFRGDSNFYHTTLINTQADEVQFEVQFPHRCREGSPIYPHVHFAPTASSTGAQAARFVLEFYAANVDAQFPASPAQYIMTKTWSTNQQYYHLIASNATPLTVSGWTLSSILKCRLYRDNTVSNNYANPVTLLYFDIHVEVDALGSATEYNK